VPTTEVKQWPSEGLGALALVSIAAALVAFWQVPRASPPVELPALVLPRSEVEAELRAEAALAEAFDDPRDEVRRGLYLAQGRAEILRDDTPDSARNRVDALATILDGWDDAAVAGARAADVLRMERALLGEGTEAERGAEIGRFAETLERWLAVEGGRRIAPRFVVRALAHARWNAIFARPLPEGMSPLRRRAYHGWLALHGAVGWSDLRSTALDAYVAAGGTRGHEARGALLWFEGEPALAERELDEAARLTGSVRLRNEALACIERGAAP
jgi:hypothetical protein